MRAIVLTLLAVVVGFGTNMLSDDGTANIGAGVLAFLAVIIASFVWPPPTTKTTSEPASPSSAGPPAPPTQLASRRTCS